MELLYDIFPMGWVLILCAENKQQKSRDQLNVEIDIIMSLSPKETIRKHFPICINPQRSENNTVPAITREVTETIPEMISRHPYLPEMLF